VKPASSEAYEAFALAYDQALGDLFFKSISRVLEQMLIEHPPADLSHLDIACGTGQVVDLFAQKGFSSIGIDASPAMIRIAARQRQGRFVLGDMRRLPFRGTFSLITSVYDSLNHLLEKEELLAAFREARRLMNKRSLFYFDMNHPSAYPLIWAESEPFESHGEDYSLTMDTSFSRAEKLAKAVVTGWGMIAGAKVPIHETHHQRPWSEREITALLREAGLRIRESFRFHPFGSTDEEPVKMFFVVDRRP
jgi:SAM-dependent methyltransferase